MMNDSERLLRDVVFPLIKTSKTPEGYKFEALLGTGFLAKENLGFTSSTIFQDNAIENICCLFVISGNWEVRHITNVKHYEGLNISSFSVTECHFKGCFNLSQVEHYSGCNFMLWGYPDEYLSDSLENYRRPDLAYHQGYIIRRLSNITHESKGTEFFEINLVLSQGFYGAPVLLKDTTYDLIGIYVGTRKFIIDKEYHKILKFINEDDNFWEKLKSDTENLSCFNVFDMIFKILSPSLGTELIYNEIKKYSDKRLKLNIIGKVIDAKEQLKKILNDVMLIISKDISINYGLVARASKLPELLL